MFSATDAALIGFKITLERWRAVLVWAAVFAVVSLAGSAVTIALAGPALQNFVTLSEQTDADPQQTLAALAALAPLAIVMLPLTLVYYGVLYAALNRIVLRPEDSRTAYLAIGADEFRQIGLLVLLWLVVFAVYMGGVIAVVVIGLIGSLLNAAFGVALAVLSGVSLGLGLIYLMVRLSLCNALTFDTGRVNLVGSWALTKGKFWPLLGAYILALILYAIVNLAAAGVLLGIVALVGGFEAVGGVLSPDMSSFASFFTPIQVVYYLLSAALGAFTWLIIGTPPAEIYRQLKARGAA